MKVLLQILSLIFGFLLILSLLLWVAVTDFGSQTGVFIRQSVERESLLDSTYTVKTYIWSRPKYPKCLIDVGSIEWSKYQTVKCYDVKNVKANQYAEALPIRTRMREFKKSGDCNP